MPDRAVVEKKPEVWLSECYPGMKILDADGWRNPIGKPWTMPITREEFEQRLAYCTVEMTQPRALVALSEDRQWLVVLFPNVHKLRDMWAILRCKWDGDFTRWDTVADTGQDAHAVLAALLSQQEAGDGTPDVP